MIPRGTVGVQGHRKSEWILLLEEGQEGRYSEVEVIDHSYNTGRWGAPRYVIYEDFETVIERPQI